MGGDGLLGALAGELRHTDGVLARAARRPRQRLRAQARPRLRPGGGLRRARASARERPSTSPTSTARLPRDRLLGPGLRRRRPRQRHRLAEARPARLPLRHAARRAPVAAGALGVRRRRAALVHGYSVAVCNSGVFGGGMFLAPGRQARRRHAGRRDDRRPPQAQVPRLAAEGLHGRARARAGGRASCAPARSPSTPTARSTAGRRRPDRRPARPPCACCPARCG